MGHMGGLGCFPGRLWERLSHTSHTSYNSHISHQLRNAFTGISSPSDEKNTKRNEITTKSDEIVTKFHEGSDEMYTKSDGIITKLVFALIRSLTTCSKHRQP